MRLSIIQHEKKSRNTSRTRFLLSLPAILLTTWV